MIEDTTFWEGKRVLVTGHNGFKGSWLTLWLLSLGAKVWGYSLPITDKDSLFSSLLKDGLLNQKNFGELKEKLEDINNINSIKDYVKEIKPEIVFHLAAQPLVIESYINPIKTWETNVIGTINLLESLKSNTNQCSVVLVTTDKVYRNKEWFYGYRETDSLGGKDPYSASKAAMELAIESWRTSFCGDNDHQTKYLSIASARAGNVIGGGDWAKDRIVPDIIRALKSKATISIRNPNARRPWQHVLEPLHGYMLLAKKLYLSKNNNCSNSSYLQSAFNFGPPKSSNKSVKELVIYSLNYWPGKYKVENKIKSHIESNLLHLVSDKAKELLNWETKLTFNSTIAYTMKWYKQFNDGSSSLQCCLKDISSYKKLIIKNIN